MSEWQAGGYLDREGMYEVEFSRGRTEYRFVRQEDKVWTAYETISMLPRNYGAGRGVPGGTYVRWRFIEDLDCKVPETSELAKAFWLVWCPTGPTPPTYRHETHLSASQEAERLSREHQGKEFYVLEAKAFTVYEGNAWTVLTGGETNGRQESTEVPF